MHTVSYNPMQKLIISFSKEYYVPKICVDNTKKLQSDVQSFPQTRYSDRGLDQIIWNPKGFF